VAYSSDRDRQFTELEFTKTPWPLPPLNLFFTSGYQPGVVDLTWDSPAILALNSSFQIIGVNIYRSFDSEFGPFNRITELPVCATFWRDRTDNELVIEEDVSDRFIIKGESGTAAGSPRWVFKTLYSPIVKEASQAVIASFPEDVWVQIEGAPVRPLSVNGFSGEIEINPFIYANVATQKWDPSLVPGPNSKVTCTYRRNRSLLKTDLGQRVFYRITTVGVPLGCDLRRVRCENLVETPLENATATSSMEVEKLDYMWREAIRRNRWILEQGGERVKIFIRKSVGIPCTCIPDDYHFQPLNDCPVCFIPGSLVNTKTGWLPIEQVKTGSYVLSSDGSYHKVREVLKRKYSGEVYSIISAVNTTPVVATMGHPFLVLRGSHAQRHAEVCGPSPCDAYIAKGDGNNPSRKPDVRLLPSGRWWARAQIGESRGYGRVALGTFRTRKEAIAAVKEYKYTHWQPGHTLEWDQAENIKQDDWLVAQWFGGVQDIREISIPQQFNKSTKFGPKRVGKSKFLVNEEFLWVVGMYLAEGSSGSRAITFALHVKEIEYQNRLLNFFKGYGFNPSIYFSSQSKNGVVVSVSSTGLAQWFPKWLGSHCDKKKIPQEFMNLPPKKVWALINGIYAGDGSKSEHEIGQTSEVLTLQLVELLHRVGEQPLVRQQRSSKLTPKGNVRKLVYIVSWKEDTLRNKNRRNRWAFGAHQLASVHKVKKFNYSGLVYNLEVEEDPTYIVNGVVVHNCYGSGIVGGFEGPYNAIIAPDDAERRIAQKDIGRTLEHTYEVFTGPTPILSQRDFLVKINGDRYSIGSVRFPSNRGMVLQQHFNIGHLDEQDIRYKVPMGNPIRYPATQLAPNGPEQEADAQITNKPNIPEERQLRGRTKAWENSEW